MHCSSVADEQSSYRRLCSRVRSYCFRVCCCFPIHSMPSKHSRITSACVACSPTSLLPSTLKLYSMRGFIHIHSISVLHYYWPISSVSVDSFVDLSTTFIILIFRTFVSLKWRMTNKLFLSDSCSHHYISVSRKY